MLDFNVKLFLLLMVAQAFDWCCQTDYQATNKTKDIGVLAKHSMIYTVLTLVFLALYGFNDPYLMTELSIILLATHMWFDSRKPIIWWAQHVCGLQTEARGFEKWWLIVAIDQFAHTLVNMGIATLYAHNILPILGVQ